MSKMNDLLAKLEEEGLNGVQVSTILAELTKMSSSKIFAQLVSALDENDKAILEDNRDSEEISEKILGALYKKYYGKTADEAVEEMQEKFASDFLISFNSQK